MQLKINSTFLFIADNIGCGLLNTNEWSLLPWVEKYQVWVGCFSVFFSKTSTFMFFWWTWLNFLFHKLTMWVVVVVVSLSSEIYGPHIILICSEAISFCHCCGGYGTLWFQQEMPTVIRLRLYNLCVYVVPLWWDLWCYVKNRKPLEEVLQTAVENDGWMKLYYWLVRK